MAAQVKPKLLVAALAAGLLVPALARGAEGQAPAPAAVTTFLLPHPDVTDQHAEQMARALEQALRKNPHLAVKDSATLLADYSGEVPTSLITHARRLFAEGSQAMLELDSAVAIRKLAQAVEALEQVLPFVQKNELADAMMALAVAQITAGERKASKQTFLKLLTWRDGITYDAEKYSPRFLEVFEEARREVRKRARGSIEDPLQPGRGAGVR